MKLIDIEKWITNKYMHIRASVKAAFFTAFALGFVIHIASISGWLVNWDSLAALIDDSKYLVPQGKWFFPVVQQLKGCLGAGSLCGPMALFYIAVSAGITVSVLDINTPLGGILTGGLMSSFLSVMSTFAYAGEDVFFFALMLSALSVYFTVRYRRGWIAGIVLLTLSVGTYQTYIGFASGLFVLYCLVQLIFTRKEEKTVVRRGLVMIGVLLSSVAAYYIILRLLMAFGDFKLSYYHNVNSLTAKPDLREVIDIIKCTPVRTLQFFLFDSYGFGKLSFRIMYILTMVLTALAGIYTVVRTKVYRRPLRLVLETILIAIMPLAVNVISILSCDTTAHWIMIYPFVLLFVIPVKLADAKNELPVFDRSGSADDDRFDSYCDFAASVVHSLSIVLTAALIFTWGVYSNHGYTRMKLAYENVYAKCQSIAEGVLDVYYDESDDTCTEMPRVAIVGNVWNPEPADMFNYMEAYTGIGGVDFLTSSEHYGYMIRTYLGFDIEFCTNKECIEINNKPEVQAMPVYPEKGSIVRDGDVIVIKIY